MLFAGSGIVVGLILLTLAADHFVIGAARVAVSLRLSKVVVGAAVIGFGTSAPELLVSGLAGAQGSLDLAVGNIVGSNVANLSLVLGTAALVTPIVVHAGVLRREAMLSLGMVILFGVLLQGTLDEWDALILGGLFAAALTFIIVDARRGDEMLAEELETYLDHEGWSPRREWARTILGLVGTLGAAQLLIVSAIETAELLGLAEGFIGLTVVAVGTSLPELAASLQAARRDETDLILGNLLGSNLFNSGAVAAVAAFAGAGQAIETSITGAGVIMMIAVAVGATIFMINGRRVVRWEGAILLIAYAAALPLLAG